MTTGQSFVNITATKNLGTQDLDTNFLAYLQTSLKDMYARMYAEDGAYAAKLTLAADGTDRFQVVGSSKATDGLGRVIDIAAAAAKSGIYFENTVGITYYVGAEYAAKPSGIQINPRTQVPEYVAWVEEVGKKASPTSVTDNGNGTITFNVNSVCESGVSNAGRQVMVYKKVPAKGATTFGVAVETRTVAYAAPNNTITTTGALGQTTVSTTAADYEVIMLGPTVRRNTDLRAASGVFFIGTVTGAGAGVAPSTFSNTDQYLFTTTLSNISDVTRLDSHGKLKIDVKADASDSGEPQISVKNSSGVNVFTVDEAGNMVIAGTQTVNNVQTVNSHSTVTNNLTAGDAAADSHKVRGTWTHRNGTDSATYLVVDGSSGRIGLGGAQDGTDLLKINGVTRAAGIVKPDANATYDLGTSSLRWATLYLTTLNIAGNINPSADNTYDLGEEGTPLRWRSIYTSGKIKVVGQSAGGSTMMDWFQVPNGVDSVNWRWNGGSVLALVMRNDADSSSANALRFFRSGMALTSVRLDSKFEPGADSTYDLGTSSLRWLTVYINTLNVETGILPSVADTVDIGSSSTRFLDVYANRFWAERNGGAVAEWRNTGGTANQRRWRWEFVGADGVGFRLYNDSDVLQRTYLLFDHGDARITYSAHLRPSVANSFDLGAASAELATIYAYDIVVGQGSGGANQSIRPQIDGSAAATGHDLGTSSLRWRNAYIGRELNWWGALYQFTDLNAQTLTTTATDEVDFDTENFESAFNSSVFHPGGDVSRFEVSRTGVYRISFRITPQARATISAGTYRTVTCQWKNITDNRTDTRGVARTTNCGGNLDNLEYFPSIQHTFCVKLTAGKTYALLCYASDVTQQIDIVDQFISFEELPHEFGSQLNDDL